MWFAFERGFDVRRSHVKHPCEGRTDSAGRQRRLSSGAPAVHRPLDDVTTLGYVERRGDPREARRARTGSHDRPQEQRVRAVARPGPRGDPGVRAGARPPHALGGRPRDRADPRRRAAVPPDAGRPRVRAHQRQGVLAGTARARARVLLPVGHAAAGRRGAARRGVGRAGPGVVVDLGPRRTGRGRHRPRSRRSGS